MEKFTDSDFDPNADIEGSLITVIGCAYYQPIADLISKLEVCKTNSPSSSNVGNYENGYSASIVILLVLAFESFISRISYLHYRKTGDNREQKLPTHKYIQQLDPDFSSCLLEDLQDVYVVRDSLAHSQLWGVDYVIRNNRTDVVKKNLYKGFGDYKMRQRVNLKTGKTKNLGCNVLPTSIGIRDAAEVFRVLAMSLDRLVKAGQIEQAAVRDHVRFENKDVYFWSLNAVLIEIAAR